MTAITWTVVLNAMPCSLVGRYILKKTASPNFRVKNHSTLKIEPEGSFKT
jgi:hypothetical protein